MDLNSLTVVLWQVCLIEALVCLILLVSIILATSRWRMAIRRAVAGVRRGATARAEEEAAAGTDKEAMPETSREAMTSTDKGKVTITNTGRLLTGFPSTIGRYAGHLKRATGNVPKRLGYTIASLIKRRKRPAEVLTEIPADISDYTVHLKNHAGVIRGLTQVSRELKEEVNKQHDILRDLLAVIEEAPSTVKPAGTGDRISPLADAGQQALPIEHKLTDSHEEVSRIPGHFQYQQPVEKQETATKKAPAKKPSLPTRHTLATKEAIASQAR